MSGPKRITYLVESKYEGKRADQVLSVEYDQVSRTLWAEVFDQGEVKLNGNVVRRSARVKRGDCLEYPQIERKESHVEAVKMPLQIRYEDEHLVVLSKDSGVVVHGGAGDVGATLVSGLMYHYGDQLSQRGGTDRQGIVHRLDRETSGLMVIAKSDKAHQKLSEDFATRKIFKEYHAWIQGVPDLLAGRFNGAIGRHPIHRHKMQVRQDGKEALTDWHLEQRWGKVASRVRCVLHTGRTHQIRVHWSDYGYPLLGDGTYGFSLIKWRGDIPIPRVMLHASRLGFHHPQTGVWREWEEALPQDIQRVETELNRREEEYQRMD